jgi:hypothetical protein
LLNAKFLYEVRPQVAGRETDAGPLGRFIRLDSGDGALLAGLCLGEALAVFNRTLHRRVDSQGHARRLLRGDAGRACQNNDEAEDRPNHE